MALYQAIELLKNNKAKVANKLDCLELYQEMLDKLTDAHTNYKLDKNKDKLKDVCHNVINETIKNAYNTHQDDGIKKALGDVLFSIKNVFNFLFSPQEFKKNKEVLGFFNTSQRVTRSGHLLHELHLALDIVNHIDEQNNNFVMP